MTEQDVMVAKITMKGLGCKPYGAPLDDPKRLCVILGKATGMKHGEDEKTGRVWTVLTGEFLGQNLETGARFRSGKCFLPSGIQESVESAIGQLADGGVVQFAVQISSVTATSPAGYSYQGVNLMPVESVTDPLADLMVVSGLSTQVLQLESASLDHADKEIKIRKTKPGMVKANG